MRFGLALLLATLGSLLFAQKPATAVPAFLDSPTEIRLSLPTPQTRISQDDFTVSVGSQRMTPAKVNATELAKKPTTPPSPDKVTLPGTIAPAIGGNAWDPNDDTMRMKLTAPGIYSLDLVIPAGTYEYKVAKGGTWAQNYGQNLQPDGQNITLIVPAPQAIVRFELDFNAGTIKDSINHPNQIVPPRIVTPNSQAPTNQNPQINSVVLTLPRAITTAELHYAQMSVQFRDQTIYTVYLRDALNDPSFHYPKADLGYSLSPRKTSFKVWSPVSTSARVIATHPDYHIPISVNLQRGTAGVWYGSSQINLEGWMYQYEFKSYGQTRYAADIYAPAANQLSTHSVIVDLTKTNPTGWPDSIPKKNHKPTQSIIYEIHIRDFTIDPNSGVKPEWRGKYLGLTQLRTTYKGQPTCLEYLKWIGVTDVHLLPFQNFNPDHSTNYNWGYETTLFNVPEEQYSTNPANPITTIRETKAMILAMHKAGLRVIQDVVYNHTVPTHGERSAFDSTVPYFYFRTNDSGDQLNESGVGNALADERPMVKKYIRDSLTFWLREYHIDGFRFDLIGMFNPESVEDWTTAMRAVRPDVLIYGEPWTGGGPTRFGKGQQQAANVAVFNDNFRNALRGDLDGPAPGFITAGNNTDAIKEGILGSINTFASNASQTINYVSAHDNLTLNDKLALLKLSPELQRRAQTLATATVLLSQGVPFLEGGPEIGRTKGGNHNSYNAGDTANKFDWTRASSFRSTALITKRLIDFRRAEPALQLTEPKRIKDAIKFLPSPTGTIAYTLKSPRGDLLIMLNGTTSNQSLEMPSGQWSLQITTGSTANPKELPALTAMVFRKRLSTP